jgi:hypothetical protein
MKKIKFTKLNYNSKYLDRTYNTLSIFKNKIIFDFYKDSNYNSLNFGLSYLNIKTKIYLSFGFLVFKFTLTIKK